MGLSSVPKIIELLLTSLEIQLNWRFTGLFLFLRVLAVTPALKAFPGGERNIWVWGIPTLRNAPTSWKQELLFASLKWGTSGDFWRH